MTLSRDDAGGDKGDRGGNGGTRGAAGRSGKRDQDIRNHPDYKTPWWRRPLKPYAFWIIIGAAAVVVVAAIIVTLSLGVSLF